MSMKAIRNVSAFRAALLAALFFAGAAAVAAVPVEMQASRSGKGVLVLQVGSDWCVSGEAVRKAFESSDFKRAVGSKFILAVYDEKEKSDPKTDEANEAVRGVLVRTKRFPAITCVTPAPCRFFAQIENIPISATPEKLARAVLKTVKAKEAAEALFKKGEKLAGAGNEREAADAYGEGFDILARQAGDFNLAEPRTGRLAWAREWKALESLDAGDRFGWVKHFELDQYSMIAQVQALTESKGSGAAARMAADARKIPQDHLDANQKQWVAAMQYALSSNGTDKPLTSAEKTILKDAFALGRDTFWGQFAMGRLMMDGEKIESKGLKHAAVRSRESIRGEGVKPSFELEQAKSALHGVKPGAKMDEKQKLAAARYAALRLIGQKGWQQICARPGGSRFLKAFVNDRVWMEDFAWSGTFPENSRNAWCKAGDGPGDGAAAALALESLVFQDGGRWVPFENGTFKDNEGRRFMTALAINYPDKDEAWLADVLDAYRASALGGRLHKTAYTQPVWLWRFATHQGHGTAGADDMAAQQRHLDKFVNLPCRDYGGTCWMIQYRLKNCFGDSVHGPYYYKPWATAGEWPKRKYSQIVGGVCGELSKFASATANAHGLPSTTVGQPGHCAYSRRLPGGTWELNYSVTGHSQMHLCFWNMHEWQYSVALEKTYGVDRESRLDSERMTALANLAEENRKDAKTVELYHRYACAASKAHYGAWKSYGDWLMRTNPALDKLRVWVRGCARGMSTGRQPVWNFLTPYFERVAKEKGAKALADDLVAFAPNLRQSDTPVQEESDFKSALEKWTAPLGKDPALVEPVLKAFMSAQYGTRDYFTQTLGWGGDRMMGDKESAGRFFQMLGEVIKEKTKGGSDAKLDFGPLILGASQSGNVAAFRQLAELQDTLEKGARGAKKMPASDFGAELLSGGGMLQTSSTSQWDKPGMYAHAIDATQVQEGTFHTSKESAPWATVVLPGPSEVAGIVVENVPGQNSGRQAPLEALVSDDGENWKSVFRDGSVRDSYRIDMRKTPERAKYVRIRREPGAKEEFFHLKKILVYGRKLY